jgi:hypothetical protein
MPATPLKGARTCRRASCARAKHHLGLRHLRGALRLLDAAAADEALRLQFQLPPHGAVGGGGLRQRLRQLGLLHAVVQLHQQLPLADARTVAHVQAHDAPRHLGPQQGGLGGAQRAHGLRGVERRLLPDRRQLHRHRRRSASRCSTGSTRRTLLRPGRQHQGAQQRRPHPNPHAL